MMSKKYLNRHEAADYIDVSLRKLDQLAADGEIPYSKLGVSPRSRVLYCRDDLDKYIENNKVQIQNSNPRWSVR